jgi:hypothetical protein
MPTNEMKRKVFLELRAENYRASLRLEGMVQRPVAVKKPRVAATATIPKTKHVR